MSEVEVALRRLVDAINYNIRGGGVDIDGDAVPKFVRINEISDELKLAKLALREVK